MQSSLSAFIFLCARRLIVARSVYMVRQFTRQFHSILVAVSGSVHFGKPVNVFDAVFHMQGRTHEVSKVRFTSGQDAAHPSCDPSNTSRTAPRAWCKQCLVGEKRRVPSRHCRNVGVYGCIPSAMRDTRAHPPCICFDATAQYRPTTSLPFPSPCLTLCSCFMFPRRTP